LKTNRTLRHGSAVYLAVSIAVAALLGVGVVVAQQTTLAAIAVVAMTLMLMRHPELSVLATAALAMVAMPAWIPMSVALGGVSFRFYEPFLLISVLVVALKYRPQNYAMLRTALLLLLIAVWIAVGLANDHEAGRVLVDTRHFLYLAMAFYVAASISGTPLVDRVVKILPALLWISALVTVAASAVGFGIAGMQSEASGSLDGSEQAARLISPATYPAVAVLCGVMALWLSGKKPMRAMLMYSFPALVVVFLSFTRNALIAIAVASIFAILASRDFKAVRRITTLALVAGGVVLLITVGEPFLRQIGPLGWALDQFDAFTSRVLGGISSTAIAADGSAQFRFEQENYYLVPEIFRSPVFGHGYGYAYKPLETGRFITEKSEGLRYYAHNFYLWILVKTGFVGLLIFAFSIIVPVLGRMRVKSSIVHMASAAAAAGLLAASFVAPMPLGAPTSVLLGALAGICAGGIGSRSLQPPEGDIVGVLSREPTLTSELSHRRASNERE
jgi:hypothetical protein